MFSERPLHVYVISKQIKLLRVACSFCLGAHRVATRNKTIPSWQFTSLVVNCHSVVHRVATRNETPFCDLLGRLKLFLLPFTAWGQSIRLDTS
jgi:hypothetical protein